jgi:hypothetical protein
VNFWIGNDRYSQIALKIHRPRQLGVEFRSPVRDLKSLSAVLSIEIVELITQESKHYASDVAIRYHLSTKCTPRKSEAQL